MTQDAAGPVLDVRDVSVRFGGVEAVREVSFQLSGHEVIGLIGPNGAGKSTTLHAVMGAVPVATGEILLDGVPIAGRAPETIARSGVALVPEGRRVFAAFSVEENLRLGLAARRNRDSGEALREVYELLPMLAESRRRPAGVLSGGQQQQLAIARALVAGPRLLLLDEPSLGLAPTVVDSVFDTLDRIRERGVTVLLVEQRAQRTVALADRTYVLANGELRATLAPADAADTDRLVAAYLA